MAELDDFDDLDDLDALDDLEGFDDLDDLGFDDPQPVAAAPAAAAASGLGAMLRDLFEKRNFQQILQIAQTQQEAIRSDSDALAIVQAAQTKLESESYIQAFLKAANQAWEAGQLEEMNSSLKKARSLDPDHPEVLRFTQLLSQTTARAATPAPPPQAAAPPAPPAQAAPPPAADPDPDVLSFDAGETPLTFGDEEPLNLEDELADDLGTEPAAEEPIADDPDDFLLDDFSFEDSEEPAAAAPPTVEEPPPAPVEAGGDEEGGDRIAQLLAEGREIFDRGEYQSAIDVWSRIFLIDIDNAEASGLIEEARSKKAELERQAEEIFHEAVAQIESESLEEAKESLRRVLELQENHSIAKDYLQQLEAGKVPSVASVTSEGADDTDLSELGGLEGTGEESPSMEAAVQRDRVVVVKRTDRRLLLLGALVSVLVIGGGAFLASQWNDLFPNQAEAPQAPGIRQVDPIERATRMHEEGQTENAIILLERIQAGDPNYENAQALVAQWKALVESPPEEAPSGPSQEQVERWQLLLGAAREAHTQRRFIRSQKLFDRAARLLPLEASDQALKIESESNLAPLRPQLDRFRSGEYAEIIPSLWRLRESEPENKDVESLIIDSYYNLALTDLQRGDALSAADKVQEVLEVAPNNTDLRRLLLFSRTYMDRPHDLLFRIYVKYLPPRN